MILVVLYPEGDSAPAGKLAPNIAWHLVRPSAVDPTAQRVPFSRIQRGVKTGACDARAALAGDLSAGGLRVHHWTHCPEVRETLKVAFLPRPAAQPFVL